MTNFHKNIFIDGEQHSLLFYKVMVPQGVKYFVSVCQEKESQVHFEIGKYMKQWRILQPAPQWVFDKLSKIIAETDFPE